MKTKIEPEKLFSAKLKNVYICLKEGPCAVNEVISRASKHGISFAHPKEDVTRSLIILEIMDIANKKISGSARMFELSDNCSIEPAKLYEISRGIGLALDELEQNWIEKPLESFKAALSGQSDKDFETVMDLLEKKNKIKMGNGMVIKNVTVFTYKKTSD